MSEFIKIDKLSNGLSIPVYFLKDYDVPISYGLTNNKVNGIFNGNISMKNDVYNLKGTVSGNFSMSCGRCLTSVVVPFEVFVDEFFSNNENCDSKEEIINFKGFKIDIYPIILSNIFMNIPMNILCSENCLGLCNFCGVNLNVKQCNCKKPIDPRFESLSSFFEK